MARVKGALNSRKRHKRTLKAAKGFYGARSTQYRSAKSAVMRAQRYAGEAAQAFEGEIIVPADLQRVKSQSGT